MRVFLNHVTQQMNIDPSTKRTRKLALKWGVYQAKKDWVHFAKQIRDCGKKLDKSHCAQLLSGLLHIAVKVVFGSMGAALSSTSKTIVGIAAATLHPSLSIVHAQPKPITPLASAHPSTHSNKATTFELKEVLEFIAYTSYLNYHGVEQSLKANLFHFLSLSYLHQDGLLFYKKDKTYNAHAFDQKNVLIRGVDCQGQDSVEQHVTAVFAQNPHLKLANKIFFPIGFFLSHGGVGHAMLAVVEPNQVDPSKANIAIVDPFGKNSGYKAGGTALEKSLKKIFPSKDTTVVVNAVAQQSDAQTCGFQTLLNIRLLTHQSDAQAFVAAKKLPKRSKQSVINVLKNEMMPPLNKNLKKIMKWPDIQKLNPQFDPIKNKIVYPK